MPHNAGTKGWLLEIKCTCSPRLLPSIYGVFTQDKFIIQATLLHAVGQALPSTIPFFAISGLTASGPTSFTA